MSTFTALNGGSPKTTDAPQFNNDAAERAAASDQRPPSSAAPPSRKSPEVSTSQKDGWQGRDRPSFQPANYPDVEGSHKRKRSGSTEVRREPSAQEQTPDTATAPTHAEARESYGTPQREYRHYGDEHRDKESAWQAHHQGRDERGAYDTQQSSATSTQGHTEEQIGDALRRATGQMDHHSDYSQTSPDADDRSMPLYGSPYGAEHRQDSILQHDPKKRKRNFNWLFDVSEAEKEVRRAEARVNCIRGGFLCAGYPPQRGPGWHKPDNKASAVPLESKDPSYVPPGAYGMPQHGAYGPQPVKREPLPHYRGQVLRIDPPQGRPLVISDDDRPTASTLASASVASPENKLSTIPYTPGNVFPTPISANTQPASFGERMAKDYQRMPPLHDLSRNEAETPHPGNPLPQINILHPTRTSSPTPHTQPPVSNAQVAAQLALSHPQYPQRRTQKEEMLSGRHYYPFDKELCLERERCAVACWRFNNLTTPPTHGVSPDERARLFLEILQPRDPVRVSPTEASPVTNVGRVGRHVAVETPFTCDYGYNISIGHHVVVGRNCTINDVCEVKIGDNCVIGPNVNIFTASLPIDPKKRQGGQGPQLGRGIIIEQDCWIGGGAIILPGRTIGKGSTVGAGSIVTKDVPPFTVVAGNPARVLRGIGI
ncbi:Putative maltose O-acetyltransferase [Tolypocladium paradoxum]|uniref:Maltose O-acetyltransferase n=1 Tax=Tolypocladium paradoxum TaxID=94208 RepID=A0A2S4KTX2_9HYPO|nr:Putative maltose O-acetyltransferase [Tolypocladium paradoxum]